MLRTRRDFGGETDVREVGCVVAETVPAALDGDTVDLPPCPEPEPVAPARLRIARDSSARVEHRESAKPVARTRVERRKSAARVPRVALTDRHEYVLALFKYGLVDSARDLAIVMNVAESVAQVMCDALVDAGLLDGPASRADR